MQEKTRQAVTMSLVTTHVAKATNAIWLSVLISTEQIFPQANLLA